MPELPEVTTIINVLKKTTLIGSKIKSVDVLMPKIIKNTTVNKFKHFFVGEEFIDIQRIGKYIIYKLTHDKIFVAHLRMEGKFVYIVSKKFTDTKHLMSKFNLENNYSLVYYDSRMFGTFTIYSTKDYLKSKEISKVAIDPLNKDFIGEFLFKKIQKINRPIKTVLLDQSIVSGIGNIYADEILFQCKIHPLTKAKYLTLEECKMISKYAKSILLDAIKHKGTTIFSYKFDKNHSGEYQSYLKVHQRKGLPCKICKTKIEKIKVNGRGTYFCPNCQKEKTC